MTTLDELRSFDLFEGLPDAHLQWILDHGTIETYEVGDYLFQHGHAAEHMYFMFEGSLQFEFVKNNRSFPGATQTPGTVSGVLPYSRMTHYTGDGKVMAPARFLSVHKRHFADMVHLSPTLGQRLVAIMSDRVRFAAQSREQYEKMMALGKLSAGLAHELNNPATAVRRASLALHEKFAALPSLIAELAALPLTEAQFCSVDAIRLRVVEDATDEDLSTLERSAREDDVTDWLDDQGVDESWLLAESLADAGFTPEDLDDIAANVPEEALPGMVHWLTFSVAASGMIEEISDAAARVAELVASVKSYSHMDRAPDRHICDIHKGILSTLTMLGHKLKKKNIGVERAFGEIPEIPVFISQLNQVWTNLLDNAIDAVPDGGTITITTSHDETDIVVRITDNGSGIPEEIQARIFEPFFTTKDVGEGSGLGLDIVQRIIRQHQGQIDVTSEPGETTFTVRLPRAVAG